MSNENENWLFFVLCGQRQRNYDSNDDDGDRGRDRETAATARRRSSSSSSSPLFRSIERSSNNSKITKMYIFFFLFVFVFAFACLCACVFVCVCASIPYNRTQTNKSGHSESERYGFCFCHSAVATDYWLSCTCVWGSDSAVRAVLLLLIENRMQLIFICKNGQQEEHRMLPLIIHEWTCTCTYICMYEWLDYKATSLTRSESIPYIHLFCGFCGLCGLILVYLSLFPLWHFGKLEASAAIA